MKKEVKVKRHKLKIIPVILLLLFLFFSYDIYKYAMSLKIKNIIVLGNNLITDQLIIDKANINNYPSFFKTSSSSIKRKILSIPQIKDVTVKKKFYNVVEITVKEYKMIYYDTTDNKTMLENGGYLLDDNTVLGIPILINYIPEAERKKFIKEMSLVNENILYKISEIKFTPNDYDKERFLLTMTDGNTVYLTLTKFNAINKYHEIVPTLEGKKGILYLDSGNHFEIYK